MKKAFTLIELLSVMMIMGIMGTAAVGGYRAMQRGMEERGVIQNANAMIRAAYQRAQIDRSPTVVFFWNETVRKNTEEENAVVVGHAVAVRRHGRLSNVIGQKLVDEFSDLNRSYPVSEDSSGTAGNGIYIYPMNNVDELKSNDRLKRSIVRSEVFDPNETIMFLSGQQNANVANGSNSDANNKIPAWAFQIEDRGGVDWKTGMAYGFEFIRLELPEGYIFGTSDPSSSDEPIQPAGTLVFKPGVNTGAGLTQGGVSGRSTVTISSLRPDGTQLKCEKVGETDSPEKEM